MSFNFIIIAVTTLISILAFSNYELFNKLKFNGFQISHHKEGWRFFSYALVHAGWFHLIVNMYVLYSFGGTVEKLLNNNFGLKGELYFLLLYVGGILFSTLFDFKKHKNDPYYNAVGASGAVSAIVFASILLYPEGRLMIFPLPFAFPSWIFGALYLIYSAYMGHKGVDNIGHNAHFWGAVFGLVFILILIPSSFKNLINTIFAG